MEMLKPTQGGRRRPLRVTAIALSSAAIGALAVGMTSVEAQNPPVAMQPVPQNVTPAWPGYADLVEKVMPAVVSVTTKRKVSNALVGGEDEFQGDPGDLERFFEEFEGPGSDMFKRFMERFGRGGQPFEGMPFGFGPRGEMPMAGAGTGFIFDAHGSRSPPTITWSPVPTR